MSPLTKTENSTLTYFHLSSQHTHMTHSMVFIQQSRLHSVFVRQQDINFDETTRQDLLPVVLGHEEGDVPNLERVLPGRSPWFCPAKLIRKRLSIGRNTLFTTFGSRLRRDTPTMSVFHVSSPLSALTCSGGAAELPLRISLLIFTFLHLEYISS